MRAIGVTEYGGPDALEVVELPEPHAGRGEIRLRVHAAAINPTDTYVRDGSRAERQQKDPPPYVPGMDAAGVVDQIGEGTDTELHVGDAAMAIVVPDGSHGAYAE
jgi:NADPH:quinone reductase-like Zn-dependent oxidoreductase